MSESSRLKWHQLRRCQNEDVRHRCRQIITIVTEDACTYTVAFDRDLSSNARFIFTRIMSTRLHRPLDQSQTLPDAGFAQNFSTESIDLTKPYKAGNYRRFIKPPSTSTMISTNSRDHYPKQKGPLQEAKLKPFQQANSQHFKK